MDEVKRDWLATSGQFHIRDLAKHFGIFQDLFGSAYFVPRVTLNVEVIICLIMYKWVKAYSIDL